MPERPDDIFELLADEMRRDDLPVIDGPQPSTPAPYEPFAIHVWQTSLFFATRMFLQVMSGPLIEWPLPAPERLGNLNCYRWTAETRPAEALGVPDDVTTKDLIKVATRALASDLEIHVDRDHVADEVWAFIDPPPPGIDPESWEFSAVDPAEIRKMFNDVAAAMTARKRRPVIVVVIEEFTDDADGRSAEIAAYLRRLAISSRSTDVFRGLPETPTVRPTTQRPAPGMFGLDQSEEETPHA